MAADQQFCLRWNNHQSTLISVFDTLLENGTLVDCTLAAEGQYLKAHKVVLSACSPYLETLLSQHYEKHPIVILKDVKFSELKSMMDYMYRGEVNISQDQLGTFLKAAESLQIKGLSDNGDDARDVGSTTTTKRTDASSRPSVTPVRNNVESKRPAPPGDFSDASRDGSLSPSSLRKRRRTRRPSQGDDPDLDANNTCDLPTQAQSTPLPVPSSTVVPTPVPKQIVKQEPTSITRLDNSLNSPIAQESGLLKEKIEPPSEPLLEPKTEYVDYMNNENSIEVEDLTLDDDEEELDSSMDASRPGPSHGDISNQGYPHWNISGDQSGTDEIFMAAQEAVGAAAQQRDSQDCSEFFFASCGTYAEQSIINLTNDSSDSDVELIEDTLYYRSNNSVNNSHINVTHNCPSVSSNLYNVSNLSTPTYKKIGNKQKMTNPRNLYTSNGIFDNRIKSRMFCPTLSVQRRSLKRTNNQVKLLMGRKGFETKANNKTNLVSKTSTEKLLKKFLKGYPTLKGASRLSSENIATKISGIQNNNKRGRGRPKGSVKKKLVCAEKENLNRATENSDIQNNVKRGRGRPKGSVKKKLVCAEKENFNRATENSDTPNNVKRMRGRPKGSVSKKKGSVSAGERRSMRLSTNGIHVNYTEDLDIKTEKDTCFNFQEIFEAKPKVVRSLGRPKKQSKMTRKGSAKRWTCSVSNSYQKPENEFDSDGESENKSYSYKKTLRDVNKESRNQSTSSNIKEEIQLKEVRIKIEPIETYL